MRDMGGKEKKILVMANVPNYQGSDKKTLFNESVSGKKNIKLSSSALPPPIPMSPIVEKMEGLKAIRNRSNSLRLGRLAFYRHLEKVETMRCFWELKHVELEGNQQVLLVGGREEAGVAGEGFAWWAGGLTAQSLSLSESVVSKRLIIQLQERDYFIINALCVATCQQLVARHLRPFATGGREAEIRPKGPGQEEEGFGHGELVQG
ncbi:hypothetical protein PBY51_024175 [Eleginops maclovinus]|uniref:Uncharacterized protein n=1 Tax=Eleginops maclovinus TaxID=56733 RepID=A0AAN7Y0U2_ELEMC|nr:hypothetical protein PBY51_024175 [Eleginops maclovinus]